ncbi:DNA adenine methylase [Fibrella sp. WM1]|uniref:DNA adenine methylase n=1 Tax=Fibrella musci TaxID=3242485 RepID=UPI00352102B0
MTQTATPPPVRYYGGKTRMLKHLLPLIPKHRTYVEAFVGGGSLYWSKEPSDFEVLNDTNRQVLDFYRAIKYDFKSLANLIDQTFHSRHQYNESKEVYNDEEATTLDMAWAVWVQANQGFAGIMNHSWGYSRDASSTLAVYNKKKRFIDAYQQRMKHTTIECRDALKVIEVFDSPNTFIYLDPPYVSSDQGHYGGYTEQDFRNLLDRCATMQGKFLLSSYPESILKEYRERYGWQTRDIEQTLAVTGKRTGPAKKKVECLTWNYDLKQV